MRLLAGVLWLGNLEFVHDKQDRNEETFVVSDAVWCVSDMCELACVCLCVCVCVCVCLFANDKMDGVCLDSM
jgi:hypothetical protein